MFKLHKSQLSGSIHSGHFMVSRLDDDDDDDNIDPADDSSESERDNANSVEIDVNNPDSVVDATARCDINFSELENPTLRNKHNEHLTSWNDLDRPKKHSQKQHQYLTYYTNSYNNNNNSDTDKTISNSSNTSNKNSNNISKHSENSNNKIKSIASIGANCHNVGMPTNLSTNSSSSIISSGSASYPLSLSLNQQTAPTNSALIGVNLTSSTSSSPLSSRGVIPSAANLSLTGGPSALLSQQHHNQTLSSGHHNHYNNNNHHHHHHNHSSLSYLDGSTNNSPSSCGENSTSSTSMINKDLLAKGLNSQLNQLHQHHQHIQDQQQGQHPLIHIHPHNNQNYHHHQHHQHAVTIDTSLTKLLECMSLYYSSKLTSPKWKSFKGLKLRLKYKIRLNNLIWRAWFLQCIRGRRPPGCQFTAPVETDVHKKSETIVLEGKYWKRKEKAIVDEYKKWRIFHKQKSQMNCFRPVSIINILFSLNNNISTKHILNLSSIFFFNFYCSTNTS